MRLATNCLDVCFDVEQMFIKSKLIYHHISIIGIANKRHKFYQFLKQLKRIFLQETDVKCTRFNLRSKLYSLNCKIQRGIAQKPYTTIYCLHLPITKDDECAPVSGQKSLLMFCSLSGFIDGLWLPGKPLEENGFCDKVICIRVLLVCFYYTAQKGGYVQHKSGDRNQSQHNTEILNWMTDVRCLLLFYTRYS